MRSCADVVLGLALVPALLGAQESRAVPEGWDARVRQQVARTWQVAADAVTLEWSPPPPSDLPPARPFVLAGRGADGWFSVVVDPDSPGRVVSLRVRAGLPDTVTVASRPLAAGDRLAAGDLRTEVRVRWGRDGDAPRWAEPGWGVRRPIAAGAPVAWPAAEPPYVIGAGEAVRVTWRRGALELSRDGVALHAARAGDPVRVRVDRRAERLVGRATASGVVVIDQGGTP